MIYLETHETIEHVPRNKTDVRKCTKTGTYTKNFSSDFHEF